MRERERWARRLSQINLLVAFILFIWACCEAWVGQPIRGGVLLLFAILELLLGHGYYVLYRSLVKLRKIND